MAPASEKSSLKRSRISHGDVDNDNKKPRRSGRISSQQQNGDFPAISVNKGQQLATPVSKGDTIPTHRQRKSGTATPPEGRPSQLEPRSQNMSSPTHGHGLASPSNDTQPFSQAMSQHNTLSRDVKDEVAEKVWGYLIPLDSRFGDTLVLQERTACPPPESMKNGKSKAKNDKRVYEKQEEAFEESRIKGVASGGYLIGRHPECDRTINVPTVSNRHCLIFKENKATDVIAILEDLSGNGTFVNEAFVGRNKRRELQDGDEIAILNEARFVFRYPRSRTSKGFHAQFSIQEQLGKGHFATVYLAVDRSTGLKYAVKKFEARTGPGERARVEGLQQEIGVLMGVSHPNVLCLKNTFNESDGIYLVLELAKEGELFNFIVMKGKLSEEESRGIFIQLFQGLKYLHERGIVHRDIKPENVLLTDRLPHVKVADFGLAKIIGEESFTTTLCGTPSYVAPEILESSNHRRYTHAVDVWSLGVVLYICLCGFPPFSDELYTKENPYNLSQQIKMGRFDYPSPYWDPVSDEALDLIDKMLTVKVEDRIDIEGCLRHQWTTQRRIDPNDSTDGLTGALGQMDFSHRKPKRERTMLSSINDIRVTTMHPNAGVDPIRLYEKNQAAEEAARGKNGHQRPGPRQDGPSEFMQTGANRDTSLYRDNDDSVYVADTTGGPARPGARE